MTTSQVATGLGMSERSVRLYAASGRIPFTTTPGGHRRFEFDAVQAALVAPAAKRRPTLAQLRRSRRRVIDCAARHGASNVRVFGSVATGTADEDSDIDLLVALAADRTYLDVEKLQIDLEALLHRRVDVITEGACHGRFAVVLNDAIAL